MRVKYLVKLQIKTFGVAVHLTNGWIIRFVYRNDWKVRMMFLNAQPPTKNSRFGYKHALLELGSKLIEEARAEALNGFKGKRPVHKTKPPGSRSKPGASTSKVKRLMKSAEHFERA